MKVWVETKELPLFDLAAGNEAKDAGMQQAAENKKSLLAHARKLAVKVAEQKGEISADDVAQALHDEGISVFALGNAMGSLFKGGQFEWTGRFTKSERVHSHGNLLRIWRLQ